MNIFVSSFKIGIKLRVYFKSEFSKKTGILKTTVKYKIEYSTAPSVVVLLDPDAAIKTKKTDVIQINKTYITNKIRYILPFIDLVIFISL